MQKQFKNNSYIGWRVECRYSCLRLSLQAVTVKEALATKGRHLRRSISTPNVQHVMKTALTTLLNEPNGNNCIVKYHDTDNAFFFFALQSSCSKTDLTCCEDEDCKVKRAVYHNCIFDNKNHAVYNFRRDDLVVLLVIFTWLLSL